MDPGAHMVWGRGRQSVRDSSNHGFGRERLDPDSLPSSRTPVRIGAPRSQRRFAACRSTIGTFLVLHHLERRSVADMAVVLAVPSGTVMPRLRRARERLQRAFERA